MVMYGLGFLPLIRELRQAQTGVSQPWYADDDGSCRTFEGIWKHMDDLMTRGTPQGYFPEPTKRILVVSPWNVPRVDSFFRGYRI